MTSAEPAEPRARAQDVQQPELAGISTDTRPIWIFALLPLLNPLIDLIPIPPGPPFQPQEGADELVLTIVSYALSLGVAVAQVLLAVADRRILTERGLFRPMRWGWAVLDYVYMIGRSVVVRRRVHGSLRPLALWAVTTVVSIVLAELPR